MTDLAPDVLAGLDPEQVRVATTFGVPVVVLAGAGTGKTRAITHRIAHGSRIGAYDPAAVLAVTFTTRAAGELRSRLRALGVAKAQARTFHSAALRQAQYFWPQAYRSALPSVTEQRMPLVAQAARGCGLDPEPAQLRDLLAEVSWAKVSNVSPTDYVAVAEERTVAGVSPATVARILVGYEKAKVERGVIDFDDILLCTCALLADHPEVAAQIRGTYRHLVVDEYQDVSPPQQTLLDLWRGESSDLCVVGDPAQTIHSFAGADSSYLTGFTRRLPDAELIRLVRDYRSTPQVVELANQLSRANLPAGTVRLVSQREQGPSPLLQGSATEADEAAWVAGWLLDRHSRGVAWRDMAVLYRIHAQSPLFEQALGEAGVPFSVRGAEGFFDRPEVRQCVGALLEAARRDPARPVAAGAMAVFTALGWSEQAPKGMGKQRERWESLAALWALVEDLHLERPGADLAALATELHARSAISHAPATEAVTLSTLHAAKGLEWEAVALVGVQEGTLPIGLATTASQMAEEARLLHVGVTRARTHLLVSWSHSRRGGPGRERSRFLAGVAGRRNLPGVEPAVVRKRGSALSQTCTVCGSSLESAAERKLRRHLDCPASYDAATWEALLAWRSGVASGRGLPGFTIFTDATLMAIAERGPSSVAELIGVPGVGRVKAEQYGPAVLDILAAPRD